MKILKEYSMTPSHKEKIASARRGDKHSSATKNKIAKSMAGKANHKGKKHTDIAKARISVKRGDYDPIKGKSWIVNSKEKTYRRYSAPDGYKLGKRVYSESIATFKDFIKS